MNRARCSAWLPMSPSEPPAPACAGSTRHAACFWPVDSRSVLSQSCGYSAWITRISPSSPAATISRAWRTIG